MRRCNPLRIDSLAQGPAAKSSPSRMHKPGVKGTTPPVAKTDVRSRLTIAGPALQLFHRLELACYEVCDFFSVTRCVLRLYERHRNLLLLARFSQLLLLGAFSRQLIHRHAPAPSMYSRPGIQPASAVPDVIIPLHFENWRSA